MIYTADVQGENGEIVMSDEITGRSNSKLSLLDGPG